MAKEITRTDRGPHQRLIKGSATLCPLSRKGVSQFISYLRNLTHVQLRSRSICEGDCFLLV